MLPTPSTPQCQVLLLPSPITPTWRPPNMSSSMATSTCLRVCFSLAEKFVLVSGLGLRQWRRGNDVARGGKDFMIPRALDASITSSSGHRKRKVVEHILLLKMKTEFSVEEEKDMLDFLYTLQYQMRGILAISLGRIAEQNVDGYTHGVYMRFQKKEDVLKFYTNSSYLGVLKDHVTPHSYGSISVDYESEVEDDILPMFRRGEDFNSGVEFVLLISIHKDALQDAVDDALSSLHQLTLEFEPLIVQATRGSNFNDESAEYTHCAIIRFPSLEALELFKGCPQYQDMWRTKFEPITRKYLATYFTVDPVGTELM